MDVPCFFCGGSGWCDWHRPDDPDAPPSGWVRDACDCPAGETAVDDWLSAQPDDPDGDILRRAEDQLSAAAFRAMPFHR